MKIKLKELFRKKEDDLDLDLDEEINDPDIRIETYEMTEDPQAKEELWDKIKKHQKFVHNRNAITMGLLFILLFGLGTFLFFHTGSTYLTSDRIERNDVSSTQYLEFGDYFLKYSSDGVACVDSRSNTKWSTTYSIQAPFVDVCGTTAVIADQQGMQVYVFDEEGLKGQFQTKLPIQKARVATQGVVAVILADDDVTWVNFYDASGTLIAENRTTIDDFGYPLDMALSPDGIKMAVSYMRVNGNKISTHIAFYNFGSAGQMELNNQVGELNVDDVLAPQIFFCDNSTAVAVRTDGFTVFSGSQSPKEKKTVKFDQEILSTFHDGNRIGFVFDGGDSGHKYLMKVYNTGGKNTMQKYFDLQYNSITLQKDKIVLFNEKEFAIYKLNGQKTFQGKYRKPIQNVLSIRGFRKYMVITEDSADLIRLG